MKVRLLAVMALVVVGAMAGTSPAMAANKKANSSGNFSGSKPEKNTTLVPFGVITFMALILNGYATKVGEGCAIT